MATMDDLCDRCIFLMQGCLQAIGPKNEVISEYLRCIGISILWRGRGNGAANAGLAIGDVGIAEVTGEFQWGHEDVAAEGALKSGWKGGIAFVEEIEVQDGLCRNLFRSFTPWTEVGDGSRSAGRVRQRAGMIFFRLSLSCCGFFSLALAFSRHCSFRVPRAGP